MKKEAVRLRNGERELPRQRGWDAENLNRFEGGELRSCSLSYSSGESRANRGSRWT